MSLAQSAFAESAVLPHVQVDTVGSEPWWTVPQASAEGFRPAEPLWRRLARLPGPWGYGALFALPLLVAFVRRGKRETARLILLAASVALCLVAGVLADRVIERTLPRPPWVRGVVQRLPTPAGQGARVLYAWGESTMHGDVWGPTLSIPKVVAWCLRGQLGEASLEVQNLAEPGTSLSRGFPQQLLPLFEARERFGTAALLVYVGHNEFYNLKRRGFTPGEASRFVYANVEQHMRRLAKLSDAAKVPVFVALPASNTEGHPPMAPKHAPEVSESQRLAYERLLDQAESAVGDARWHRALAALDEAGRLSPQHAWHWFLRGRTLRALRRDQEALDAFRHAVRLDHNRQRATERYRALLKRLCRETSLVCVDSEEALRRRWRWLDDTAFIDIHHPVAAGHFVLGQAFADQVATHMGLPTPRRVSTESPPADLDPRRATLERLVQTAGWYLVLATELKEGYPRARRAALRRAEANVQALRSAQAHLTGVALQRVVSTVPLLHMVAAAIAGDVEQTQRRWEVVRDAYDWSDGRHPIPEEWMLKLVGDVIGRDSLRPPQ